MLNPVITNHNGERLTLNFREDIKSIHVRGNRWFQKTYGNTYHKVYVTVYLVNGDSINLESKLTYGYGDHYRHTAGLLLAENGFFTNSIRTELERDSLAYAFHQAVIDNRGAIFFDCVDVERKRDL